jgi:tetratricopeptide (TPR) repeat protein
MRIPFKNIAHAKLYLKTCNNFLTDHLQRGNKLSDEGRLPSQRIRNAFCRGFGYNSYEELTSILTHSSRELRPVPSEKDFLDTFVKGFSLAFEVVEECGLPLEGIDYFMPGLLAQQASNELMNNGSADGLFEHSSSELAEDLMDSGWSLVEHYGRGEVPEDRLSEAEHKFRLAIKCDPELADAYNGLAYVEFARHNYEGARHHSEKALEKARHALGTDDIKAFTWYGELKTRPYMRARHTLGLSFMNIGDRRRAISEFRELLKRNPNDNQGVRYLLGPLYHADGDLPRAITTYNRAAGNDQYSGDPHNEFNYALALYETGKAEEAALRFRYGIFLNPHIPEALFGMPVRRLNMWYGINTSEPYYALEYRAEYDHLWKGKVEAIGYFRLLHAHTSVQSEFNEFYRLHRELDEIKDISQRTLISHKLEEINSLRALRKNNKEITSEVIAAARQALSTKIPKVSLTLSRLLLGEGPSTMKLENRPGHFMTGEVIEARKAESRGFIKITGYWGTSGDSETLPENDPLRWCYYTLTESGHGLAATLAQGQVSIKQTTDPKLLELLEYAEASGLAPAQSPAAHDNGITKTHRMLTGLLVSWIARAAPRLGMKEPPDFKIYRGNREFGTVIAEVNTPYTDSHISLALLKGYSKDYRFNYSFSLELIVNGRSREKFRRLVAEQPAALDVILCYGSSVKFGCNVDYNAPQKGASMLSHLKTYFAAHDPEQEFTLSFEGWERSNAESITRATTSLLSLYLSSGLSDPSKMLLEHQSKIDRRRRQGQPSSIKKTTKPDLNSSIPTGVPVEGGWQTTTK